MFLGDGEGDWAGWGEAVNATAAPIRFASRASFPWFVFSSCALQPALFSLNLLQPVPSRALTPGHSGHYLTELPSVLYLLTHPRHVALECC